MATPRQHATWALVLVVVAYVLIPASMFAPPWGPYQFDTTNTKYGLWAACGLLTAALILASHTHRAVSDDETEQQTAARSKRTKRVIFWSVLGYLFALVTWVFIQVGTGLAAAGA